MNRLLLRLLFLSLFILLVAACGSRPTPLPSAIVPTDAPTRTAFPTMTATPSPGLFTAIHSQITYVPTRTPTPTKTHTLVPTTTLTLAPTLPPTITPTFAPTLPPATPIAGPQGYRLREWLFQDAQLAVSEAEGILELWDWAAPDAFDHRDLYEHYFIAIGQETTRRFPQAVAATNLYWKLGAYEAETWNHTHPVENFRLALETSLNSGEMVFSQLDDWLEHYRYFWLCCTKGKLRARKSVILNVWQKENQLTASATGASITNRWSNGAV